MYHDVLSAEGDEFPERAAAVALDQGARTCLSVPLLREGESIGAIVLRRTEVRSVQRQTDCPAADLRRSGRDRHRNVRLFEEVQAKTRDLTESLEQQTATSEVLEVISSSTGELEPVFEKMLENATRICGAKFGTMNLLDGDSYQVVALYNVPPAFAATRADNFRPHPKSGVATATRRQASLPESKTFGRSLPYLEGDPAAVAISDRAGATDRRQCPDAPGK